MPITPHFSWDQDDNSVTIVIEMCGINKKLLKHFVQITPIFFSLNISPYLLQIDFENKIDPYNIKVIILNKKETKFIFPKQTKNQKWNELISTKDKKIKLKERKESIDELYKKQQEIRERRKKEKILRFKSAQQRQWDEEKYMKHIINKLENKEKETSELELKQWIKSEAETDNTQNDDDAKEKQSVLNEANIRKTNVIEVGFTEWDYVIPNRNNTKPPIFARKRTFGKYTKEDSVSEITPVFVCDKGMKYFMNKDYESALNAFNEAINLDNEYLEAYSNKFQCYIRLKLEGNNDKHLLKDGDLIKNIDKMESILQSLEREETEHMMNESVSRKKNNITTIPNIIISFQKGIIYTFLLLNKVKRKEIIDDEMLILIRFALNTGSKMFEINQKLDNFENNFGLFKDVQIIQNLHKLSKHYLNIVDVVSAKRTGDKLMKVERYLDAIDKYSDALKIINKKNDDYADLEHKCLNNRSTAYFSSKQYEKCINDCDQIVAIDNDFKALIKRAGSYLSLWKNEKNNINYLEKSLNDYQIAAQCDSTYASYASKVERLLQTHLVK